MSSFGYLAGRLVAPRQLELTELPTRDPEPWEAVVQVALCGICGTDLSLWRGDYRVELPIVPGHEFVGMVAAVGAPGCTDLVGRRVTAEITVPRDVMIENLRITPQQMHYGQGISTMSAILSNSSNNAAHPANGLAALYLATGQDIANIGESNQCTTYNHVTRQGDYYFSITFPSLIVATYGGGTALPTQRECLEIMDCFGPGKALKLAEIAAALTVAGELSLGAAARVDHKTRKNEWVDAHEKLGRNR